MLKNLLFTLFVGVTIFLLDFLNVPYVHVYVWYIYSFFAVLHLATHAFTLWGINNYKENFAMFYFGAMIFRFFCSISLAFVIIYRGVDEGMMFVVNFFILYFIFIIFEIYSIIANLRPHSKKGN